MEEGKREAGFGIEISPDALQELAQLDASVKRRLSGKIEWLAANAAETAHHRLSNLPAHLRGLCKRREGDYRILYWVYPHQRLLKIYGIIHRSSEYKGLR